MYFICLKCGKISFSCSRFETLYDKLCPCRSEEIEEVKEEEKPCKPTQTLALCEEGEQPEKENGNTCQPQSPKSLFLADRKNQHRGQENGGSLTGTTTCKLQGWGRVLRAAFSQRW